jgi:predicted aspartyl protease
LNSTHYPYEEDGILRDGSKVPDIPVMNLLIVRRDRRKGLLGESIVDTGFDAAIYASLNLVEFLEGATPKKTASLQTAGRDVICEVFDVECYIMDQDSKLVLPLGRVDAIALSILSTYAKMSSQVEPSSTRSGLSSTVTSQGCSSRAILARDEGRVSMWIGSSLLVSQFEAYLAEQGIKRLLCRVNHAQTKGKLERFYGV